METASQPGSSSELTLLQSAIITPLAATNPSADIISIEQPMSTAQQEEDVLVVAYTTISSTNQQVLLVQLWYIATLTASTQTMLVAEPQIDFTYKFARSEGNPVVVAFKNIQDGFAVIWKRYPESNTTQIPQLFIRTFDSAVRFGFC